MEPRAAAPYSAAMTQTITFGDHLRTWRQRRRLSQMELALDADISTRHLSFIETGRSVPSREMVLRLAEQLAVPLRERNVLLVAAGYAPVFQERALDDPALAAARQAVEQVLAGHEPFPALAIDRHWNLISANRIAMHLLAGVDPALLEAPINVLRLSLHPLGIAPRIVNLPEWRDHIFARLRQQIAATADAGLVALLAELQAYRAPDGMVFRPGHAVPEVAAVIPLQLASEAGVLSFVGTTMMFGTPVDITLSELAIEAFFPADAVTAEALRQLAAG